VWKTQPGGGSIGDGGSPPEDDLLARAVLARVGDRRCASSATV
jgi:hypothetical protein